MEDGYECSSSCRRRAPAPRLCLAPVSPLCRRRSKRKIPFQMREQQLALLAQTSIGGSVTLSLGIVRNHQNLKTEISSDD